MQIYLLTDCFGLQKHLSNTNEVLIDTYYYLHWMHGHGQQNKTQQKKTK